MIIVTVMSQKKFSIFDEPTGMDEPIYMSMYDKVKNRRSCVKQREAEVEQRRQQEALLKFCKLKQQRAQREGKKKSMDSDYRDSDINDSDESPRMKNNKPRSRFMLSTDSDSDSGKEEDRKGKKKQDSSDDGNKKINIFKKRHIVDSSDDSDNRIKKATKQGAKAKGNLGKIGLESSDEEVTFTKFKVEPGRTSPK